MLTVEIDSYWAHNLSYIETHGIDGVIDVENEERT